MDIEKHISNLIVEPLNKTISDNEFISNVPILILFLTDSRIKSIIKERLEDFK